MCLCVHRAPHTLPGAPQSPQAARSAAAGDGQCAKLNAIFGSAVLPLTLKSGIQIDLPLASRAPPKQRGARTARPGAPQAPQAVRSAAAGGGQQVREIKRHFRFRGFATNIEIRYKST